VAEESPLGGWLKNLLIHAELGIGHAALSQVASIAPAA